MLLRGFNRATAAAGGGLTSSCARRRGRLTVVRYGGGRHGHGCHADQDGEGDGDPGLPPALGAELNTEAT